MKDYKIKPKIIHVDDDRYFCEIFAVTFNKWFKITSVLDSSKIIEQLKKEKYEAIITDYEMPVINGIDLLEKIKKSSFNIPVIFYTGQGNEEIAREAFIKGAADYFTKEFFGFAHKEKVVNSINKAIEIKRTEEAKTESEVKFKELFNNANDGIFLIEVVNNDRLGNIIEANDTGCQITGYSKEELIKMTPKEVIDLNNTNYYKKSLSLLFRDGKAMTQNTIFNKNGKKIPVEINSHTFKIKGKNLLLSIVRDITKRKKAEKEIKESRRTLSSLMSNLPGMVYRCKNDKYWTLLFLSNGCYDLTEYHPEELLKDKYLYTSQVVYLKDQNDVWRNVQKALKKREPYKIIFRIKTKSGKLKWVFEQGRGVYSPCGDLLFLEGFIQDITKRINFEKELEHREEIYKIVMKQTGQLVYDYDILSGKIKWLGATEDITGYSYEEINNFDIKCWEKMLHPDDRENTIIDLNKSIKAGLGFNHIYRFKRKDGLYVHINSIGEFLKDKKGNSYRMLGVMKDITEKVKSQEEIMKSESLFDTILEDTFHFIGVLEPNGKIIKANNMALNFIRADKADIIGKPFWLTPWWTHSSIEQKKLKEGIKKASKGEYIHFETTHMRWDNKIIKVDFSLKPVKNEKGRVILIIPEGKDITNIKKIEEELENRFKSHLK